MEVRRKRSKALHLLSEQKKRNFYLSNIDTTRQVLFEQEEDEGFMYGFTENYIKVKFPYNKALTNTFQTLNLVEIDRDGIMICEPNKEVLVLN